MSARLITLAVNIALMGFLLVERIASTLQSAAWGSVDVARLRSAAEILASGHSGSGAGVEGLETLPDFLVRQSLADGFGLVMLYGGIGAWILAGLSFILFRPAPGSVQARSATKAER